MNDVREARNTESAGAEAFGRLFAARDARARSMVTGIFGGGSQEHE
jgi:hypothetical protein